MMMKKGGGGGEKVLEEEDGEGGGEKRKDGKNANDARTLGKVSSYGDGEKQWIEVIAGPDEDVVKKCTEDEFPVLHFQG